MAASTPASTVQRRPIRGVLYGIVFGLGLALVAVGQGWAALGTWPPFIIFALGLIAAVAWSTVGPAKGAQPANQESGSSGP